MTAFASGIAPRLGYIEEWPLVLGRKSLLQQERNHKFFSGKLAILGKASVFVSGIVLRLDYIKEWSLVLGRKLLLQQEC